MTKQVHVTDVREIKGVKITCRKCGAYWFVPLGGKYPPESCHNCGKPVSGKATGKLMVGLESILAEIDNNEGFDACFETENTGNPHV